MDDEAVAICPECDNEFDPASPAAVEDLGLVFCCAACRDSYERAYVTGEEA